MPIAFNPETNEALSLNLDGQWEPTVTAVNPNTNERLVHDGNEWVPWVATPDAQTEQGPSLLEASAGGLISGITAEFDEEIRAGVQAPLRALARSVVGGDEGKTGPSVSLDLSGDRFPISFDAGERLETAFDASLKQIRGRKENLRQARPAAFMAGQVAGAVQTAGLVAPAVSAQAARLGINSIPRVLRFGGLGALEGGAFGAGAAEGDERLAGAGEGAAAGLVAGVVAPYLASGVAGLVNRVRNAFSPGAGAAADIGRALARDATTPQEIGQAARVAAQERPGVVTLADVGGENVRGLVERVAQTPGAGRTQVIPRLTDKQRQQAGRLTSDLRQLTGTRRSAFEATEEVIRQRKAAADPLYDEALAFNAREDLGIVRAWQNETSTGFGQAVLNSSNLRRTLQTEYGIQNAADAPLMVVIDAWKKGVDDLVAKARKDAPNRARVLTGMKNRVIDAVDRSNPAYAVARDAWAGPAAYLDAIDEGRKIGSRNVSAEEMRGAFRALGQSEQEAFRTGAISSIMARMGNDASKLGDMTKFVRSPEMRAKIAAIMPTPELAEAWARRLDFEVGSSELTAQALGNSATARRLAERADAEDLVTDLVVDALSGSGSISLLRRTLTAGPRAIRDTLRSRTDNELGDLLTNPDRIDDLDQVLQSISVSATPQSATTAALATTSGVPLAVAGQ